MSVDTLAPRDLSRTEAKNQRTTKSPRIQGLKGTRSAEAITKIREHELYHLEVMVMIPFYIEIAGHTYIENPLTSHSFLRDSDGNETRPSTKSFPL